MEINGLPIPEVLLALFNSSDLPIGPHGRLFWTAKPLGQFFLYPLKQMKLETSAIQRLVEDDPTNVLSGKAFGQLRPITFLPDFTKLVCIGERAREEAVCLDYHESPEAPGVIWFNPELRWQLIAPNLAIFLPTLVPAEGTYYEDWMLHIS